jgi:hypothetical protein
MSHFRVRTGADTAASEFCSDRSHVAQISRGQALLIATAVNDYDGYAALILLTYTSEASKELRITVLVRGQHLDKNSWCKRAEIQSTMPLPS